MGQQEGCPGRRAGHNGGGGEGEGNGWTDKKRGRLYTTVQIASTDGVKGLIPSLTPSLIPSLIQSLFSPILVPIMRFSPTNYPQIAGDQRKFGVLVSLRLPSLMRRCPPLPRVLVPIQPQVQPFLADSPQNCTLVSRINSQVSSQLSRQLSSQVSSQMLLWKTPSSVLSPVCSHLPRACDHLRSHPRLPDARLSSPLTHRLSLCLVQRCAKSPRNVVHRSVLYVLPRLSCRHAVDIIIINTVIIPVDPRAAHGIAWCPLLPMDCCPFHVHANEI